MSTDNIVKMKISYEEYGELVNEFTNHINMTFKKPTLIIALQRGGLAIGLHLSHYFNSKLIIFNLNEINKINDYLFTINDDEIIYVVDDVCDSGKTLSTIQLLFKKWRYNYKDQVFYFTIHKKNRSTFQVDWYLKLIGDNIWLVYPWEKDETPDKDYMLN